MEMIKLTTKEVNNISFKGINILLIFFTAIVFRIFELDNIPGINGDEAWYGVMVQKYLQGEIIDIYTPSGNILNPFYIGSLLLINIVYYYF